MIPGKERVVYATFDELARQGVEVVHRADDPEIHVSGHAARRDQRRMLELVRPQAFVPVHGTRHHLVRHAQLAQQCGVNHVAIIENGQRLRVHASTLSVEGTEPVGRVHYRAGRTVDDIVLRDRALLSELGLCVLTLVLDPQRNLACPPRVFTRGVLHEDNSQPLLQELATAAARAFEAAPAEAEDTDLIRVCCHAARRIFQANLGYRPPVHCLIHRVACDPD